MTLTFVNVGYGEAILLECPDETRPDGVFTALIDGGSAEASEFSDRSTGRLPLAEYLRQRGLRHLDLAVSTHIHEDHLCGLLEACKVTPPTALWQILPPSFYRSLSVLDTSVARTASESKFLRALNDYTALCALVEESGGTISAPETGETLVISPDLSIKILAPFTKKRTALAEEMKVLYNTANACEAFFQRLDALDARMNNYSLVLLVDYRGTRMLLPGDTNVAGYEGIPRTDLRADLFKVGHHGQKDGADEDLARAISPKAVVCCASSDRRYNSAHPDVIRLLWDNGATLYYSDCPTVPGGTVPPHEALRFDVGRGGELNARYLSGI